MQPIYQNLEYFTHCDRHNPTFFAKLSFKKAAKAGAETDLLLLNLYSAKLKFFAKLSFKKAAKAGAETDLLLLNLYSAKLKFFARFFSKQRQP